MNQHRGGCDKHHPPVVVNKKDSPYDIYIGRGSVWGNPFVIGRDGTREEVIEKYRHYLWKEVKEGRIPLTYLKALQGKRLGCFCAPLPCHGDVLVKACKWACEVLH